MSKNSFKANIRERYKGRGNCWIKIGRETSTYQEIINKIKDEPQAVDYLNDIKTAGFAWVRFVSPNGTQERPLITCEIRYLGSKTAQPECTIDIDDNIAIDFDLLGNTPFKLELEKKHIKEKKPVKPAVVKPKKSKKEKFVNEAQKFQESIEEVIENELLNIKEAVLQQPTTSDIIQWKAFLKSEGLLKNV